MGKFVEDFLWSINFYFLGRLDDEILTSSFGTIVLLVSCGGGYFINGANVAFGNKIKNIKNNKIIFKDFSIFYLFLKI